MKTKKILSIMLILVLLCSIFAGLAIGCKYLKVKKNMSIQLFEQYRTSNASTTLTVPLAQKFTIGETGPNKRHGLTSISLYLYREGGLPAGWPGKLTFSIREADENGLPASEDLVSVGIDSTTIASNVWFSNYSISLPTYLFLPNHSYFIVFQEENYGMWLQYHYVYSDPMGKNDMYVSSGSTWVSFSNVIGVSGHHPACNLYFAEYGVLAEPGWLTLPGILKLKGRY